MVRGEDKLAIQVGAIGYFGKVTVESEPEDRDGEVIVDFDPSVPDEWKSGASFGVDYVLEHIATRTHFPNGGRVRVLSIGGHPVDTNNVVIAFVAANALYKALGILPTMKPEFDKNTGTFTFPK
jgi:hypothetical protein